MLARFHIVGCVIATEPDAPQLAECLDWVQRLQAEVLGRDDRHALFAQFEAADAQLVLVGCRAAVAVRPPVLRFGFANGIKEASADGRARIGERGIAQAADLAAAAQPGEVLLSSQFGSLLQIAQVEPAERIHPRRVMLRDGRPASAFAVDLRGRSASRGTLAP